MKNTKLPENTCNLEISQMDHFSGCPRDINHDLGPRASGPSRRLNR
jgi:hypothetical protein